MPLTALSEIEIIDATACRDGVWSMIYRTRPRPKLLCRGCQQPVHAKISSRGLRFFAHDRSGPTCPSNGETPEHRYLKTQLAAAIRQAGWRAQIEAAPEPRDVGGWRADVLAIDPDSHRRIAFEVQLASMSNADGLERTTRYDRDTIAAVWITTHNPPWLWALPGFKLTEAHGEEVNHSRPLEASRGLAVLDHGRWEPSQSVALDRVVSEVLAGQLVPYATNCLSEELSYGQKTRSLFHRNAVALVSTSDAEQDRRRIEVDARQAADDQRHRQAIKDLYERQGRVLFEAHNDAVGVIGFKEKVWIGVPSEPLMHSADLASTKAAGNEKTAQGAVLWLGLDRSNLRLFAVACPVASRITPGLAENWRQRNVRVYVADQREAVRIASALAWPVESLWLRGSGA